MDVVCGSFSAGIPHARRRRRGCRRRPATSSALLVLAVTLLVPREAGADVVYAQPHDLGSTMFQSSGNGNDYDMFVWDDFTLGSDADVTEVDWRGGYMIPPAWPSGPVLDFSISFWGTIAGQPDIGAGPLWSWESVGGNAGETPAGTFGGVAMYDYAFALPTSFHAAAGTTYWVRIGAFQAGVPGWGLAAGSGGNGVYFASFVNYAGGTAYRFGTGDAAFSLRGAAGPVTSTTSTTVSTTTSISSTTTSTTSSSTTTITSTTMTTTSSTTPPADCAATPANGCRTAAALKSLVLLVHKPDPAKNVLKWRWKGGATTVANFKNPVNGTPVLRACLYDGSVALQPLTQMAVLPGGICGTAPCWMATRTTGFRYANAAGTPDGVTVLKLTAPPAGQATVLAKGKGAALPMPNSGLTLPVTVQLVIRDAAGSTCWQTTYATVLTNDSTRFKAKGP